VTARRSTGTILLLLVLGAAGAARDAAGQIRVRNSEAALLREAAALESRGDYEGAEVVLRRLLEESPTSSGGLFALERVLRQQGDVVSILPAVDAFLAQNPESSGVRSLGLRVLVEADSTEAVRRGAEAWLAADPQSEVPYREVSRVYEGAFGVEAALEVLARGRETIGRPDALALERGDLLAGGGDVDAAADEWSLAIGEDAGQVAAVVRRIRGLDEGADAAGERLVVNLAGSEALEARRAGARIAVDLRLEDRALGLVRDVAGDLDGRARTTFLSDIARRAREHDLVRLASWAYDELGEEAATPAERRQFDQRVVDVALASGDTVAALAAQRRLAASFAPGSVDRRRASAQVIRLQGSGADAEELREMLASFREEFPNAPELDELTATVAGALQSRGDAEAAAGVLEGVAGPQSSLERAYLHLAAGDLAEGRAALLLAVTGLPPSEATSVIELSGLLGRLSPEAGRAIANAGVEAHRGRPREAATRLAEAASDLGADERAPVLAQAAKLASDGGELRLAAGIRQRLVEEHPDAPELAEASLALARWHARTAAGRGEAIRLLEDLIIRRPNAAVVPDARLELEKLRGRGDR
jgi:tetratricopeptide (TPR) repeat protein